MDYPNMDLEPLKILRKTLTEKTNDKFLHLENCTECVEFFDELREIFSNDEDDCMFEKIHHTIMVYFRHAAENSQISCVKFVDEFGTPTKSLNALHIAVCVWTSTCKTEPSEAAIYSFVKSLLDAGCPSGDGKSPPYIISSCILRKLLNVFKLLIEYEVDINNYGAYQTPAMFAINQRNSEYLKLLLQHGGATDYRHYLKNNIPLDQRDEVSLIHFFAIQKMSRTPELYLQKLDIMYNYGVNLWERNRDEMTALQVREDLLYLAKIRTDRMMDFIVDFQSVAFKRINERLRYLMSKPHSLKQLCRITITKAMGLRCLKNIHKLHLSQDMINYMQADELIHPIHEQYESDDDVDDGRGTN